MAQPGHTHPVAAVHHPLVKVVHQEHGAAAQALDVKGAREARGGNGQGRVGRAGLRWAGLGRGGVEMREQPGRRKHRIHGCTGKDTWLLARWPMPCHCCALPCPAQCNRVQAKSEPLDALCPPFRAPKSLNPQKNPTQLHPRLGNQSATGRARGDDRRLATHWLEMNTERSRQRGSVELEVTRMRPLWMPSGRSSPAVMDGRPEAYRP